MNREQFISLIFISALAYIAYQTFTIFSVFFNAIFGALILAFLFYPIYKRIRDQVPKFETFTALIMTLVIFLLVLPPIVMLVVNLAIQIIELSQSALLFVKEGGVEASIDKLRGYTWIKSLESQVVEWDILKENAATWTLNTAKEIGNMTAAQLGILTKNLFLIALNIFFMLVLVFVFLKDGSKIYDFIYQIAPFERRAKKAIADQIRETFEAVIRGQILTSFAQSFVAGIVYWALDIPGFIFWAVLTFITSMVPIGAAGVWFPLTLFLFFTHQHTQAWILLGVGALVISTLDNFIKPAVIGERTQLPYFLLLFGILGGLAVYGFVGIFLAPVVLSLFFALIKIYREQYLTD